MVKTLKRGTKSQTTDQLAKFSSTLFYDREFRDYSLGRFTVLKLWGCLRGLQWNSNVSYLQHEGMPKYEVLAE